MSNTEVEIWDQFGGKGSLASPETIWQYSRRPSAARDMSRSNEKFFLGSPSSKIPVW